MCVLQLKSNISINLCFWLSFLKHVSSLTAGVFWLLQRVSNVTLIFLKQKKVDEVVPEYSNWPNIHVIYIHISFPTDIYVKNIQKL